MTLTNPWLAGPAPTRRLDRARLEDRIHNVRAGPRVSVGIFAPLVGQASSRGAQIFGSARILEPGDDGFDEHWPVVRWQSDHVERGRSLGEPPLGTIGVIAAERIVYTEHWLRRDGCAPRQFWRGDQGSGSGPAPSDGP